MKFIKKLSLKTIIKLENIKFSKNNKKFTCNEKKPLYKGLNADQLSFNFQCVKWAEV